MHPILFNIVSMPIYSYSVYLTAGCLLAMAWTMREARLKDMPYTLAPITGIIAIVCGLIGARALYVALYSQEFIRNPVEVFYIWQGGLVFSGALFFGTLSGLLYLKSQAQPLLQWLDCIVPGIALGQAVGRLGCFFAGCCYGKTTSLPWGVTFSDPESLAPLGHSLHPTQLYHSLSGLLIFITLMVAKKFIKKEGKLTGLFLILFSVCRFIIEFFRADYRGKFGPLSLTQFLTLIILLIGFYLLFVHKHRRI